MPAIALGPGAEIQYDRRRPENTLLYKIVQENLETFLTLVRAQGEQLPDFVEREFEAFLHCGILANGFLRLQCEGCHQERLVAFSCKKRGFCPSCGTKRMVETSAWLMDHVIPVAPIRQWVLSFPIPLRYLMAARPKVMGEILGIANRAISTWIGRKIGLSKKEALTGGVTLLQRFGSSLNLNIHFHTLMLDGAYTLLDGKREFFELPPLKTEDVEKILDVIVHRILRMLERRGLLTKSLEEANLTLDGPTDALDRLHSHSIVYRIAYGPRAGQKVFQLKTVEPEQKGGSKHCLAKSQGFSLHAGTLCLAGERKKLEFLCRYITRPAVAEERLRLRPDGNILLKLKTPFSDGTTHIMMTPLELLQKLAALVPRPRIHLVRFHGVFAPHAKHRKLIVPQAPTGAADPKSDSDKPKRLGWARLLARIFDIDVETCRHCGKRIKIIAAILAPKAIERILIHLGLPSASPIRHPARGPPSSMDPDQLNLILEPMPI